MVEGPGCKVKGERMRVVTVGQVVNNVSGAVVGAGSNYRGLVGLKVEDVKTLGKELFIFFENNLCVRLHFLMDGFVRYNNDQGGGFGRTEQKMPGTEAKLCLELSRDVVSAYQCSVEIRPGDTTLKRWHAMISLDICWSNFDAKRSADAITSSANLERLICDVMMDQEVMPGVGNIIKNEALFNAGVLPISRVTDLPKSLVNLLVKMTRDFSLIFYNCRKFGKALEKHYNMYMFSQCKSCGGRVTKCKPGEYKRGTYFCSGCQTNSVKRPRPAANSLLGWVQLGGSDTSPWTCLVCTMENKPGAANCMACGTSRNKRKAERQVLQSPSAKRQSTAVKHQSTADAQTELTPDEETLRTMDVKDLIASGLASTKSSDESNRENTNFSNNGDSHLCKVHQKPCRKRIVNKEGDNKGRSFWSCSTRRSCSYFAWADLEHPRCKHGAITFVREVYKLNQNNGKSFYVCPKQKKDQCDFFQWK